MTMMMMISGLQESRFKLCFEENRPRKSSMTKMQFVTAPRRIISTVYRCSSLNFFAHRGYKTEDNDIFVSGRLMVYFLLDYVNIVGVSTFL